MDWTKINSFQIDLTSHCNARCGACTRNVDGGPTVPNLTLNHFDIKVWERLFTKDLANTEVTRIVFNGMWGDPAMHPLLPEMLDILHDSHPETIITSLATNGGTHTPEYWARLGTSLARFDYHAVDFGIDGLADTHEMYRRRVKFDRIMANAEEFMANGGNGQWIMTVFDHNKHQLDEAANLAAKMGFNQIRYRKSNASKVYVNDGKEEYTLTTDNVTSDDYGVRFFKNTQGFLPPVELTSGCPWYNQLTVQLDPWHQIWPCCHIATHYLGDQYVKQIDPITGEKVKVKEFDMQQEVYSLVDDNKFNDLTNYDFFSIMNHSWFQEHLTNKIKDKSLLVCDRNCGIRTDGRELTRHNV
jgi:hypothetical protein